MTPSAACAAASDCEQHLAGLLGSDWARIGAVCSAGRPGSAVPVGLVWKNLMPEAGFGIALFISLVVFF